MIEKTCCFTGHRDLIDDTQIIKSNLKSKADKIVILSDKYYNGCMQARNRHMVNHSKYIICYKRKTSGGTAYTVNYANKKGLTIIEI